MLFSSLALAAGWLLGRRRSNAAQTTEGKTGFPEGETDELLRLDVWMRQLMLSGRDREHFYRQAAAGVMDLAEGNSAFVCLFNPEATEFTVQGAVGDSAETLTGRHAEPIADGAIAWVMSHGEPLLTSGGTSAAQPLPDFIAQLGPAVALAPIHCGGRSVGVLCAVRDVEWTDKDRQVLIIFGQKVSIAAENMDLVKRLERERDLAEVTLHSIGDAVITTDPEGLIEYLNPVAETLTGWTTADARGVAIETVFNVIDERTRERISDPIRRALEQGVVVGIPPFSALVRRDGREFAIDDSAAPIRDRDGSVIGAVLVFHDVSVSRAMARELTWQATHDSLTGLANRKQFEDNVRQAIDSARERDQAHVLMYMDLDQFKVVNDTCGHMAGDELLKQLTVVLRKKVRELDTLARLGGDEFGVLLMGCPAEAGLRIAEKFRQDVRSFRFVWEQTTFEMGVSIGLVAIDKDTVSLSALMSAADMACHMAKETGRNRVHAFAAGDETLEKRQSEMQVVSKISSALEHDRFVLHAQPITPTTGTDDLWEHVEILVRMLDVDGKIVPPNDFIPAAERYGLMGDIDRWVVENVFRAYQTRMRDTGTRMTCAINLTGQSMSDEKLLEFIRQKLVEYEVPAERICFEITETAAVQNLGTASRFIHELRKLGCSFALDDFGSGLSSFAYLKNLPVDYLKIDGSFVRDMLQDKMNSAIVQACYQIGVALGIKTIAEFVEDKDTLAALAEIGVDYSQGWGISRPRPLEEVLAELSQLNPATAQVA